MTLNAITLMVLSSIPALTLVDFNDGIGTTWINVDDDVMGGRSQSKFTINKAGNGVFYGVISLENNGGFSSVRHRFNSLDISQYTKAIIRVKGAPKNYQFRVKRSSSDQHAYKYEFTCDKMWVEIEIPFDEMIPTWRGTRPDLPNFEGDYLSEIGFLIANKKAEPFELEIDKIWLE